jgi:hypothetical protein
MTFTVPDAGRVCCHYVVKKMSELSRLNFGRGGDDGLGKQLVNLVDLGGTSQSSPTSLPKESMRGSLFR